MMKRLNKMVSLILALTIFLCAVSLAGCGDASSSAAVSDLDESAFDDDFSLMDDPITETTATETTTVPAETTATVPVTPPTAPAVPKGVSFNNAVLGVFSKTYADVVNTYGNETKRAYESGGQFVLFERSAMWMFFGNKNGVDKNNNAIIFPTDTVEIVFAPAKDIFVNYGNTIPIADLEKVFGCKADIAENMMDGGYFVFFSYQGYSIGVTDNPNTQCFLPDQIICIEKKDKTADNVPAAPVPVQPDALCIELTWPEADRRLSFTLEALPGGAEYPERNNRIYDFDGKEIAVMERSANTVKMVFSDTNIHCAVSVIDMDWEPGFGTMNPLASANASVRVQKGATTISDGYLELYRSYTGYWAGGVCNIRNGNVEEYRAAWF